MSREVSGVSSQTNLDVRCLRVAFDASDRSGTARSSAGGLRSRGRLAGDGERSAHCASHEAIPMLAMTTTSEFADSGCPVVGATPGLPRRRIGEIVAEAPDLQGIQFARPGTFRT
jgi:hypothetical protein